MRSAHAPALELFRTAFGGPPERWVQVPGRVELLGNHTDYNAGLVLAAAIQPSLTCVVAARPDRRVRLISSAFPSEPVELRSLQTVRLDPGHWAGYIVAVYRELRAAGISITGFDAAIDSTIPPGSGLSSSAALLVAVALALGRLPHRTATERLNVAQLCQRAEHRLGVHCGLLDYLTVLHAREDHAVHIDCRSLAVKTVHWPDRLALVLVDSEVRHRLIDGGYNRIRSDCEAAAASLGVATLREIRATSWKRENHRLTAAQRSVATHFVEENQRVRSAIRAIRAADYRRLGELFTESHHSSRVHLRNSCPELDAWIERARPLPGWLGGRLTGGGFGGMTLHLVKRRNLRAFLTAMPKITNAQECRPSSGIVEG